jgi:hypothetical protein
MLGTNLWTMLDQMTAFLRNVSEQVYFLQAYLDLHIFRGNGLTSK